MVDLENEQELRARYSEGINQSYNYNEEDIYDDNQIESTELAKGGLRKRLVASINNEETDVNGVDQNSSGEENHTLLAK